MAVGLCVCVCVCVCVFEPVVRPSLFFVSSGSQEYMIVVNGVLLGGGVRGGETFNQKRHVCPGLRSFAFLYSPSSIVSPMWTTQRVFCCKIILNYL